jgi:MerR family transcriptional regulator, heat shock protein HspR
MPERRRAERPGGRPCAVYVISVAAELAGVHPQTLRIYERKGLVDPARTGGGSRRYSDADIALLRASRSSPTRASTWPA